MDRKELKMKLLTDFQKKYPTVSSADLQTFTLGMIALEESLDKEVGIKGNLIQLMDEDDEQAGLSVWYQAQDKFSSGSNLNPPLK